jgi:Rrf2 family transcriptional regulator, cysteine metabolism repressor
MTLLNRKVDYSLLILCYLYHREAGGSAREIAAHFGISRAFVANILKDLCQQWFVISERGVHGGYRLHGAAAERTLAELIDALDSPVNLAECNDSRGDACCSLAPTCPIREPITQVHNRIRAVLENVRLVEVFTPAPLAPAQVGLAQAVPLEVSRCAAARVPG